MIPLSTLIKCLPRKLPFGALVINLLEIGRCFKFQKSLFHMCIDNWDPLKYQRLIGTVTSLFLCMKCIVFLLLWLLKLDWHAQSFLVCMFECVMVKTWPRSSSSYKRRAKSAVYYFTIKITEQANHLPLIWRIYLKKSILLLNLEPKFYLNFWGIL